MIDPYDLTKPWDERRLQEWFVFGVCVAGKSANQTAYKVEKFLETAPGTLPFDKLKNLLARKKLEKHMREWRLGQYRRIGKTFRKLFTIDPATIALEDLEQIPGIGPKTARMLLLYTRPGLEVAPLDTHILKWLKSQGYDAPKTTPPAGPKYRALERAFIAEGKKRGMNPKEWDTAVWQAYAAKDLPKIAAIT